MVRIWTICGAALACLLAGWSLVCAPIPEWMRAQELYQKTEYQQVLRLLAPNLGNDAAAYSLAGKSYYFLGDYKKATHALEKAVELDPKSSDYFDWLGKVYGKRAETSSPFTAWSYAGKTRKNFERAIELDSRNLEAIDDLFEFSLNAPGFIGGGPEKAAAAAELARGVNPAKYHSLWARLAEKQKDYQTEEQHLRAALELAPSHMGRIVDMAQYLARRGRFQESDSMFERAWEVAPNSAELKFEQAKTYIHSGRNRDAARKLLQQYLESSLTPDDPPRSEAERLLKEASSG